MKRIYVTLMLLCLFGVGAQAQTPIEDEPTLPSRPTWSSSATAAAMGYCLSKHPYLYQQTVGATKVPSYLTILKNRYTLDGYQMVDAPGIVGAVRRNFVYRRSTTGTDAGINNTCEAACKQFGQPYAPTYNGVPLKQNVGSGEAPRLINSGIGDMAAGAMPDKDFYLDGNIIGGMWSRANTFQESDVAQADFCCCQCR